MAANPDDSLMTPGPLAMAVADQRLILPATDAAAHRLPTFFFVSGARRREDVEADPSIESGRPPVAVSDTEAANKAGAIAADLRHEGSAVRSDQRCLTNCDGSGS